MCGIFGFALFDSRPPGTRPDLAAMASALSHRGPDGWGAEDVGWAGIGATRLRLIDLRRVADPPARSEDGQVTAVLNGEIYNHAVLREELIAAGHDLADRSDAALLPHLWEEHGEGLFMRLRGAFAIALLDRRRQCLVLARDRLGEKPLVVASGVEAGAEGLFVFASEPRALAASGAVTVRVDEADLGGFLRFGHVPSPQTGLQGIRRLDPGTWLILRRGDDRPTHHRFWHPRPESRVDPPGSARPPRRSDLVDRVGRKIEAAVHEQLVADRATAVVLSGGIDSGLVAAAAVEGPRPPVEALTVRVPGGFDETTLARRTAEALGLTHRLIELPDPGPDEALGVLARIGEPLADSSALAVDRLCAAAAEKVVAVLSGDGGDELFGGYRRYAALRLATLLRSAVPGNRSTARTVARTAGQILAPGQPVRRFMGARRLAPEDTPAYWRSLFWDGDAPELLGRADLGPWPWTAAGPLGDLTGEIGSDPLERARLEELSGPLRDDLLVKMDRLSMAHGVEVRCPFLDHRLVEAALAIPARLSVGWLTTKRLLRRLARARLPRAVARARKRGFGVPLAAWLRGSMRPLLTNLTGSLRRGEGPFDPDCVERLVDAHLTGRADHGQRLWALVVWQSWCAQVADWNRSAETSR